MYKNLINNLTKCLVDTLIAIEFSDEKVINKDLAVNLLEQLSAELYQLHKSDKDVLIEIIFQLSKEYPDKYKQFIQELPDNLGII